MNPPPLSRRMGRLLTHDTSLVRLVTSFGLILMGVSLLFNLGTGVGGYRLMEDAMPLPFWGVIYGTTGAWGIYGCIERLPYWIRIFNIMAAMWLWAFVTLAQFADEPLPTRTLLILPALVEFWSLVKVVAHGPRKDGGA